MILFKKKTNQQNHSNDKNLKYPDHIKILDDKNFQEFINKYELTLIDFWAPWCAPCKSMAPRMRRLSTIFKGKIAFGKLDTSLNKKTSTTYNIMSIPQIIIFKNGKKATTIIGLKSTGELKKIIDNLLKN